MEELFLSYSAEEEVHSGPFLGDEVMMLKGLDINTEPTEAVNPQPAPADLSPPVIEERKPAEKKAIRPKWLKM